MKITEKSDEEIREIADPMWNDLIKNSNKGNYGKFIRNFSRTLVGANTEVELGKQFAHSAITKNMTKDPEFLGVIRRGEYVTVLYKQRNDKMPGEWLGRLVLGYEDGEVKIFGATVF